MNTNDFSAGLSTFGRKGSTISYSAGTAVLGNSVKAVVVCAAGNVVYTPKGDLGNTITMTDLPAGYVLPHIPGTITQAGTTATLATIED